MTTRKYTTLSVSANKEEKRVQHVKKYKRAKRACVFGGGAGGWGECASVRGICEKVI